MNLKTSKCRDCPTLCIWAITSTGKLMPVDAEPKQNGNLILREPADPRDAPTAVSKSSASVSELDGLRYVSHVVDCPGAEKRRKTR